MRCAWPVRQLGRKSKKKGSQVEISEASATTAAQRTRIHVKQINRKIWLVPSIVGSSFVVSSARRSAAKHLGRSLSLLRAAVRQTVVALCGRAGNPAIRQQVNTLYVCERQDSTYPRLLIHSSIPQFQQFLYQIFNYPSEVSNFLCILFYIVYIQPS